MEESNEDIFSRAMQSDLEEPGFSLEIVNDLLPLNDWIKFILLFEITNK